MTRSRAALIGGKWVRRLKKAIALVTGYGNGYGQKYGE